MLNYSFYQWGLPDKDWLRATATSFNVCALSFIAGVCLTLLFRNLVAPELLLTLSVLVLLACLRQKVLLPFLLMLLGFTSASLQFSLNFNKQLPTRYEGQTIRVVGELQGLPQINPHSARFNFKVATATTVEGTVISALMDQIVVISCYRCDLEFAPNQKWALSVRLKRPHSYASWGAFDYEKYLFRHKVIATGYIRSKDPNSLLSASVSNGLMSVNHWRWQIKAYLDDRLPNRASARAIMAALMIGDKSQLSDQQRQVFQKTGISHLMAISGLHIGLAFLVTGWLLKWCLAPFAQLFNWVPRQKLTLAPALLVAFTYAALAGFAISTQRAMIMLALYALARVFARDVSLLKILMITVLVIFVYDPLSILDVGFWLSCFAVMVIALINEYRAANNNDAQEDDRPNKVSLIKLQPILWLSMLPLTLLFFGKISLLSPFVNLLLVPLFCGVLIPLTLLALVLKGVGLLTVNEALLPCLSYCYEWVFVCLAWLAELPFAQIAMPPMTAADWLLFLLAALAYFLCWRVRHILALAWVLLLTLNGSASLAEDEFNVALLDVGQGLAMVVEARNYVLVYDTGPAYSSGFNTAEAVLIPYLQSRGIRQIDTLIVSHADNDHIGGFSALEKAMRINQIVTSRVDKIPQATECRAGQNWSISGVQFKILSPDVDTPSGSNNRSCVLMVSNDLTNVLISGDIEKQVERYLIHNDVALAADILLVPHQGSKTSSTAEFIDAVDPDLALIAAGYRNHYGHPHGDVVSRYSDRGIKLYSTIESGSILLNIKDKIWKIRTYRDSEKGFWHPLKKPT